MPRHLRIEFPGAIYHVCVRGNARQRVFLDHWDRKRFLRRLAESVESYEVRLYMFCLMSNHYHLVVETPKANISRFMQSLETGYARYFNLRHGRTGHVTQGRYAAKMVEGDEYLLTLARYLDLNPVRSGRMKDASVAERRQALRNYSWSSYRSYAGIGGEYDFVDYGPLRAVVGGRGKRKQQQSYRQFIEKGIAASDSELLESVSESPRAIGSEDFLKWIDELYFEQVEGSRKPEDISFRKSLRALDADDILQVLAEEMGVGIGDLQCRQRGTFNRSLAAQFLWQYGGLTKRAVAGKLGLGSGAAADWQIKKLERELGKKSGSSLHLRKLVRLIDARLEKIRKIDHER